MDPIQKLRKQAHRLIIIGEYVYAVRRVRPEELLRQGYAQILATVTAHAQAEAAAAEEQRWADRLAACTTDEQRAQAEADRQADRGQELIRQLGKAVSDPAAAKETLAQCDAYIRASVTAIGTAKPGVQEGLQEPEVEAADVCEPLGQEGGEPRYLMAARFVDDDDPGKGQIAIANLDQAERMILGHLAMIVSSGRREVTPFRRAS